MSDYVKRAVDTALGIHREGTPGDVLLLLPGTNELDQSHGPVCDDECSFLWDGQRSIRQQQLAVALLEPSNTHKHGVRLQAQKPRVGAGNWIHRSQQHIATGLCAGEQVTGSATRQCQCWQQKRKH